jgi:hypothetical protein
MATAAHDLDPELTDFISGGTDEEINASADQLAGIIDRIVKARLEQTTPQNGGRAPGGARPNRPVESMRPGAAPASQAPATADEMFRNLLKGD